MVKYFIAVLFIVCNVIIVPGHPFPGQKAKNQVPAVSYTIVTKHEQQMYPAGHDDYKGYPDLHSSKSHNNTHAKYRYSYGVKDPKTGDMKKHWESRDGHKVKGGYSLKEADGTTRIVHYSADKDRGFEAVVKKIGKAKQQQQKEAQSFKEANHTNPLAHNTVDKGKRFQAVVKKNSNSKKQKQKDALYFIEANRNISLANFKADNGNGFQEDVTKIGKAKNQNPRKKKRHHNHYTRMVNANSFAIFAGH